MKAKIMFFVSVLFLMTMSIFASAVWTGITWNQWSDDREIKFETQYSSISDLGEANKLRTTETRATQNKLKTTVLKNPNAEAVVADANAPVEKFHKSTTVASSSGITKLARVQKVSYTKKPNGILNMRAEVLVGNTHQRLRIDQNIPSSSPLSSLKVYDFVKITFKKADGVVGGRGTRTLTEIVSFA